MEPEQKDMSKLTGVQETQNMGGSSDLVAPTDFSHISLSEEAEKDDNLAQPCTDQANKLEEQCETKHGGDREAKLQKAEEKQSQEGQVCDAGEDTGKRVTTLINCKGVVAAGGQCSNNTIIIAYGDDKEEAKQQKAHEKQSVVTDLTVSQLTDLLKNEKFMDTTITKIEERGIDGNTLKLIVQDEKALDEITCVAIDKSKLKALVDKKK